MFSNQDIRYGENPFPYGANYDRGVGANVVIGEVDNELGLTVDKEYLELRLYPNMAEAMSGVGTLGWGSGQYAVTFVATDIIGDFVTITASADNPNILGVLNKEGALIGIFYTRARGGSLDPHPSDPPVFDSVVTPEDLEPYEDAYYSKEAIYSMAISGHVIYYFAWNSEESRVDGAIKRVMPVETNVASIGVDVRVGVFVPIVGGSAGSPIPAFFFPTVSTNTKIEGGYEVSESIAATIPDSMVKIGEVAYDELFNTVIGGGLTARPQMSPVAILDLADGATANSEGYTSGFFYDLWYDSGEGVGGPNQNSNVTLISGDLTLLVRLLDNEVVFSGGTPSVPNYLVARLRRDNQGKFELVYSNSTVDIDNQTFAQICKVYIDGTKYWCTGTIPSAVSMRGHRDMSLKYNALPNGSKEDDVLTWSSGAWTPKQPDEITGEGSMPEGADKNTMFYDGTLDEDDEPVGWVANTKLLWEKHKSSEGVVSGDRLVIDASASPARSGPDMPGFHLKNAAGDAGGVYANMESGAKAGLIIDLGEDGRLRVEGTANDKKHNLLIDITEIDSDSDSALEIVLRETYVLEMDDGKLVAKKRVVLCSESYGDAEEMGDATLPEATDGQVLRYDGTADEWEAVSFDEKNVVVDVNLTGGKLVATKAKVKCFEVTGSETYTDVFSTVKGAGEMSTATTVGHTHL